MKFLKDKSGASYFSLTISLFIIMITFAIIIFTLPIFSKQQDLDTFAKTILRQAEIEGTVEQDETYDYLCDIYKMKPTIDWDYDEYRNKKVQLNKKIKVTLGIDFDFEVGGIIHKITIPLKSSAYGRSEVYWK